MSLKRIGHRHIQVLTPGGHVYSRFSFLVHNIELGIMYHVFVMDFGRREYVGGRLFFIYSIKV